MPIAGRKVTSRKYSEIVWLLRDDLDRFTFLLGGSDGGHSSHDEDVPSGPGADCMSTSCRSAQAESVMRLPAIASATSAASP